MVGLSDDQVANMVRDELTEFFAGRSDARVLLLGAVPKAIVEICEKVAAVQCVRLPSHFHPVNLNDRLGLPGDLDFNDDEFDAIVAFDWIELTQWMRWSVNEIHRVLSNGGRAFIDIRLSQRERRNRGHLQRLVEHTLSGARKIARLSGLRTIANSIVTQATACRDQSELSKMLRDCLFDADIFDRNSKRLSVLEAISLGSSKSFLVAAKKRVFDEQGRFKTFNLLDSVDSEFADEIDSCREWSSKFDFATSGPVEILNHESLPQRLLVLSPHPDDELIGSGGTIIKVVQGGGQAAVLHLTNGRSAAVLHQVPEPLKSEVRVEEARQVAEKMRAEFHCWTDTSDGDLNPSDRNVQRLVELIDRFRPDAICTPFLNDEHADHYATNLILREAIKRGKCESLQRIFGYEVWSFCPRNAIVPVTSETGLKRQLLQIYRTALRPYDYLRRTELISGYRMLEACEANGYAEAFVIQSPASFLELIDLVEERRPEVVKA